jgi:hypothetical protein
MALAMTERDDGAVGKKRHCLVRAVPPTAFQTPAAIAPYDALAWIETESVSSHAAVSM